MNTVLGSVKITAIMIYTINVLIALTSIIIFKIGNRHLLIITTVIFALFFLFIGRKLDKVPIVVPANQQKHKTG